ncbi:MAG: S8 family peptidase [Bacteroidales bacterium]|nr:S8 family peptidase [Bacteroidales bacterium]
MKKFLSIIILLCGMMTVSGQMWLNKAVPDGRVDSVWAGVGLPQGFNGEGVIIGLTDWGFDYSHPVFYDTNMVRYRVLRAWDQYKTSGPAPAGFDYGTEYVGPEELLTARCDTINPYDYAYHGTHCASIAGGAGAGTVFRGVAPEAQFLFATIDLTDQAVIDAWNWMYNVAQTEGKRLVISMSWGVYMLDNMDGTGPLADEVKRLTDLGVVFVTSAGNNGDVNFHLKYDFTQHSGDTMRTQFTFPYTSATLWGSSITMVNSANSPFAFSMNVLDNACNIIASTPFVPTAGNDGSVDTFLIVNGDTIVYDYEIHSTNEYNHAPGVRLRVKYDTRYKFGLAVTAAQGVFHAWNVAEITKAWGNWGAAFQKPASHPDWIAGDIEYGISTPANIDEIITVAAHQATFKNPAGATVGGDIADFSSSGPGFHNVRKPEISAPGKGVISAISSYTNSYTGNYNASVDFNGRTYRFASLSGTSMSSPFVAGVVALMLQANPYLTVDQVRDIITETARNDAQTAAAGINRFGYGKINAYQAVLKALVTVGMEEHLEVDATRYSVFPNPSNGQFYVSVATESQRVQGALYDIAGRMVYSTVLQPGVNTLDIQNLPSGYYILRLNDGMEFVTKKIVKK